MLGGWAQPHPFRALDDDLGALVPLLDVVDGGDGGDLEEVLPGGILHARLLLGGGDDAPAGLDAGLDRGEGPFAAHGQGNDDLRKDHRVLQRQHGVGFSHGASSGVVQ